MTRILVVDDDLSMREFLDLMLLREGYEVKTAPGGREALDLVAHVDFDLVISDIRMKEVSGIDVLKGVKEVAPRTVVILISAFANAETAVVAMKEGAYDFIPKPFNIEELKSVIRAALAHRTPEAERRMLTERVKEGCHFGSLVGLSPAMLKVYDLIRRAAQTATNILITGESGTGKELVAKAIHDNSPRRDQAFVAINCGGMPEQLIESELFGHRKGAFTGAHADKAGLFETAHKGTLFLDELAELSMPMQVKLLRAVQDKTFRAVGGTQEKSADVRFIAATNKELEREIMAGRFREDLYYRLNVINIHMPPLSERKGDIPLLAQFFLDKYAKDLDKDVRKISSYALDILQNYAFPGNVRELENIIERSVALEQSNIILPESLTLASYKHQRPPETPFAESPAPADRLSDDLEPPPRSAALDDVLAALERMLLLKALCAAGGARGRTADLLGITAKRLRARLKQYQLADLDIRHLTELAQEAEVDPQVPHHLVPPWTDHGLSLDRVLVEVERDLIEDALHQAGGSKTEAARLLGVTRRTLHHRLSRVGLSLAD
jgi:two-component system response regulator PilR (NtrC family)